MANPTTNNKTIPIAEAKARVIDLIQQGLKVAEAMAVVDRREETYRSWMKDDPQFKADVTRIRTTNAELKQTGRVEVPDFDVFCRDWLKQPLHPHQLRMWDVIEGREPRDIHPSMDYLPANTRNRVLINVPPDHAKSTTFTVNYSVWRIHKDPSVRIAIMSQSLGMAKKFLYEIKQKLTSSLYREMHMRFAPEHTDGTRGWKDPDGSWTNDAIYVMGKGGETTLKDPTVQALGLGGQIYGARLDVIFLDDIIVTKNAREWARQMVILDREIQSRLPSQKEGGGLLAIMGTRVSPVDLYGHLVKAEDYVGNRMWTYFRQPAVLDYGDGSPQNWQTLWPERWDGESLANVRKPGTWNLVYQQLNVDEDMTFQAEAVDASVNRGRFPGPMSATNSAHRRGMEGLHLVGGLDPAASGGSAIIIAGLDRETGKRYIIDGWFKVNANAEQLIEQVQHFIVKYQLREFVVEQNAFQRFFAQLRDIKQFAASRGCQIVPHSTTANKFDENWGVETMAPLFNTCVELTENGVLQRVDDHTKHMIELPSPRQNEWVNTLIQQLTTWQPQGNAQKQRFDLVMALWFTHTVHQRVMQRLGTPKRTHLDSQFMSPAARKRQTVVSLSDMRRQRLMEESA